MNHLTVFAEYRAYLFAIAQRILGSAVDVEDLLQETFIRWQQTPLAQIRSPKAFLSTVIKRLCLNHLESAYVRHSIGSIETATEVSDQSIREVEVSEPSEFVPPQTLIERITPALAVVLERLSPKERLVLLLREVFDYDYEDIAPLIKKNANNCRQLLRRAHQHLLEGKARFTVSQEKLHELAREFTRTCSNGDLRTLVAALS